MRLALLGMVAIGLALAAPAGSGIEAQQPPATDIHIAPLTERGGRIVVGPPRAITDRAGYDNQPSFTTDGGAVLYTSIREDAQADIYRYDLRSGQTERVTRTPESEYSPTITPGGDAISVIRVEADSTQRLWSFPLRGGDPRLVLEGVRPVGYHTWLDATTLALFILGEPPTLQRADTRSGIAGVVATAIGRSIQRVPGRRAVTFVEKLSDDEWWISEYDADSGRTRRLVRTIAGVEDHAWTPGGSIIAARAGGLYSWRPGAAEWSHFHTFEDSRLQRISRLAVNIAGDQIALVSAR